VYALVQALVRASHANRQRRAPVREAENGVAFEDSAGCIGELWNGIALRLCIFHATSAIDGPTGGVMIASPFVSAARLLVAGLFVAACANYEALEGPPTTDEFSKPATTNAVDPRVFRYVVRDATDTSPLATPADHPARVCLATRIGPRSFLTAAHCLVQKLQPDPISRRNNRASFRNGVRAREKIFLNAADSTEQVWTAWPTMEITYIYLHPNFLNCVPDAVVDEAGRVADTCGRASGLFRGGAGEEARVRPLIDLAVIEVAEALPSAPRATLATTGAAVGERLDGVGWGCTAPEREAMGELARGQKMQTSFPVTAGGVVPEDPWGASRFQTAGGIRVEGARPVFQGGVPLCPEDDGAPLFRGAALVGIRSRPFSASLTTPLAATDEFVALDATDGEVPTAEWLPAVLAAAEDPSLHPDPTPTDPTRPGEL